MARWTKTGGLQQWEKIFLLSSLVSLFGLPFLTACGSETRQGTHVSVKDYEGLKTASQTYGSMVDRVAAFLLRDEGKGGIREEGGQTIPPYFYSYGICDARDEDFGCIEPDQLTSPVSYPAYTCYVAIEAFTRYYIYSGNQEVLDRAVQFAEWVLDHLTPETDMLAGFPYSTQAYPLWGGGMDGPSIELDKAAMFAIGLLRLYDMTSNASFYLAADHIAGRLLQYQGKEGSWAFRVIPQTGGVYRDYTSNQIYFVRLMDQMFEITGVESFHASSQKAWEWILRNPVSTKYWANFYEDMDAPDSLVNFDTMETIRHLLAGGDSNPDDLSLALSNFQWIENTFLLLATPYPPMIPSIGEQTGFVIADEPAGTTSSTAQWASLGFEMHEASGDSRTLKHAFEAANVVASAQQADGRMFTVTADANGGGLFPITWYEQCFVPLWFMLDTMEKRPETAPEGEDHMLGYSTAVRTIEYAEGRIQYVTKRAGEELIKVSAPVLDVRAGGMSLPVIHDEEGGVGWTYDPEAHLLRVRHTDPDVQVVLSE